MRIIFITFIGLFWTPLSFGTVSLEQAYQSALKNMESIQRAQAAIVQAREQKNQLLGTLLPTVAAVGNYTKIEPPEAAGRNPFLLTQQYSAAIQLRQPVFRGGSYAAYQLAKENVLLANFQKEATALNLYQLVINAYFNLSIAVSDVKNVEKLLQFSKERVKEIKERTLIGRSRKGELIEAEAQFHIAQSQYQQVMLNLKQAQENFEFLTSINSQDVLLPEAIPDLVGSVGEYLVRLSKRPDILATAQQIQVANKQVDVAKGGHYPQVDLVSNYFLERTGILETSTWDVGASVVIPIYQGGTVQAEVKQAIEQKRIAELTRKETFRSAERDIRISYQNILQIKQQLDYLRTALKKAEQVYQLNKKDYKLGLVTNLDVLQSLNVFIETKRSLDNLIALGNMNYKNLQALTGVLP